MRTLSLCLIAALLPWTLAAPASAQDAGAPAAQPTPADATQDRGGDIVVPGYRDRAMDAFMRGDFVTAEIEFTKNYQCTERTRMLQEFAVEQAVSDAVTAEVNAGAGLTTTGFGNSGAPQIYNLPRPADQIPQLTCSSPEWQLYMMALSEIQLGKLGEAKRHLYRVIQLSNNDYLLDAHYRLGLLELLDGNVDLADRRLSYLRHRLRGCDRRQCEIGPDLEAEIAYLNAQIAKARRTAGR